MNAPLHPHVQQYEDMLSKLSPAHADNVRKQYTLMKNLPAAYANLIQELGPIKGGVTVLYTRAIIYNLMLATIVKNNHAIPQMFREAIEVATTSFLENLMVTMNNLGKAMGLTDADLHDVTARADAIFTPVRDACLQVAKDCDERAASAAQARSQAQG